MTLYVAPIVEGQTEVKCLERVLQRVWNELLGRNERMQVLGPFRGQRDALLNENLTALSDKLLSGFFKLREALRADPSGCGLVLLLLDAEDDCPKKLAPLLVAIARKALPSDASFACVLAKRMLENWFVAGAHGLGGLLPTDATEQLPDDIETLRADDWIDRQRRRLHPGRKYKKTVDSARFAEKFDLRQCRANSPSFDKLCQEMERLTPTQPPAP